MRLPSDPLGQDGEDPQGRAKEREGGHGVEGLRASGCSTQRLHTHRSVQATGQRSLAVPGKTAREPLQLIVSRGGRFGSATSLCAEQSARS